MNTNDHSIIDEIFYSFLKKRNHFHHLIENNEERIQEIDVFLKSVENADADLKYFSPRTTEDIYKDKIEEAKQERSLLQEQNQEYRHQEENLSKQIEELKSFIEHENHKDDLSAALFDIQEKDRQRIARELHDTTVQNLAHLIHKLDLTSLYIDKDPIQAKLELETGIEALKSTIDEMRTIIFNLRPMSFQDLGFKKCLEDYMQNLIPSCPDILFEYRVDDPVPDISENRLLILFRIIQEAVHNAVIHSHTDKIELQVVQKPDSLCVSVKDYGVGFTDDAKKKENHFGFSMMQERARIIDAEFRVHSILDQGTEVIIVLSVNEQLDRGGIDEQY